MKPCTGLQAGDPGNFFPAEDWWHTCLDYSYDPATHVFTAVGEKSDQMTFVPTALVITDFIQPLCKRDEVLTVGDDCA